MITVIDNYYPQSNLYEGMTFSEALDNVLIDVYEACNNMMMDTLLAEHAYLYENATEIVYENEDGSENKNGRSLKERFFATVDNISNIINSLFDKLIDSISNAISNIKQKMASLGLNEKKIDETVKYIEANNIKIPIKLDGWNSKAIEAEISRAKDSAFIHDTRRGEYTTYAAGEYFKKFEEIAKNNAREDDGTSFTKSGLFSTAKTVVLQNNLVKDILAAKKKANDSLRDMKKTLNSIGGEGLPDAIAKANAALKSNAAVCKDLCKAYDKYYFANAKIISVVVKAAKSDKSEKNKAAKEKERQEKKDNFSSTTMGKAIQGVKNTQIRAKNSLKNAVNKL